MSTICAISTPVGNGGVGIIRISGDDALTISQKVFDKLKQDNTPRKAIFGKLKFNGVEDDALAIYFKAPNYITRKKISR